MRNREDERMSETLKRYFDAAALLHSAHCEMGVDQPAVVNMPPDAWRQFRQMCLDYKRQTVLDASMLGDEVEIYGVIFRMKENNQ